MNFTFSSSRDTAYVQFKDFIGRKTLFLIIEQGNLSAWDMQKNLRYSRESILLLLPFFELIDPKDLIKFLWGEIPSSFSDIEKIKLKPKKLNGDIQFKTGLTEYGILVNSVSFRLEDENAKINFITLNRDFDAQYPHLIRKIPESLKLFKESL